ncbi:MAG: Gfo/Idh/MocA family oxidoreductase [Ruminococcaceae bacterium]|nr:Gfo/Idh/MocA family oxidoreductase [Oscillospiraceae bacterium]
MIKVGFIGFGGIAQAHRAAYDNLAKKGVPVSLVSACDIDPEQFTKRIEINLGVAKVDESRKLATYTDLEEMLAKENLDMIDICLPTFLHAPYAIDMLKRGYHVLSEKPMARTSALCLDMVAAAKQAKGNLMIGQCLRFFPQYEYLKKIVDEQTYGRVISARFSRLSGPPIWAWQNWFMDYERSGGCLLDMHIHDLDMARYLFGEPQAVSCRTQDVQSRMDVVHSVLFYEDIPVVAVGDWSMDGYPFSAGYMVGFEKATVIFEQNLVKVYPRSGEAFQIDMDYEVAGIEREIEYFIGLIENGGKNDRNPPESAARSVMLAEALRDSALAGGKRIDYNGGVQV